MKTRLLLLIVFTGFFNIASSQQNLKFDRWNWLIGEWKDDHLQQSGYEGTTFSFTFDLDRKIIVRKSTSEIPDITAKHNFIHTDLMIIYLDPSGIAYKAIYFDNEGYIINYKISFEGRSVVFKNYDRGVSKIYKLTYTQIDNETISRKFELSRDGEIFTTFEEGKSIKIK
jgi:hypothetical protein